MNALKGEEVVSYISKTLRARFSEEDIAKIYKNKPVQSMTTPCIFIHSVETSHDSDVGNYAWWTDIIDIRCHPSKLCTNVHSWARKIGPIICDCVSKVTISGQPVKAKSISWRVEDNVVHITASYRYRVIAVSDYTGPVMEELIIDESVKA